jgi:hypothetical protein
MKKLILLFTVLTLVLVPVAAMATTYDFFAICDPKPDGWEIGEQQFKVDVTDDGSGNAVFKFSNTGPTASFINQIYFYEKATTTLLNYGSVTITNGTGVDYEPGASPTNLSGLAGYLGVTTPTLSAALDYSASAKSPGTNQDGVDPGQYVQFTIPLVGSFSDLITALNYKPQPTNDYMMILGIHGQGLGATATFGGNSCGYVQVAAPIPGSLILLGTGVLGLVGLRRKLF